MDKLDAAESMGCIMRDIKYLIWKKHQLCLQSPCDTDFESFYGLYLHNWHLSRQEICKFVLIFDAVLLIWSPAWQPSLQMRNYVTPQHVNK